MALRSNWTDSVDEVLAVPAAPDGKITWQAFVDGPASRLGQFGTAMLDSAAEHASRRCGDSTATGTDWSTVTSCVIS